MWTSLKEYFLSVLLITAGLGIAVYFIIQSEDKDNPLSTRETIFFHVYILSFNLVGSFLLGRKSLRNLVREQIKPAARSSFRRVISLGRRNGRLESYLEQGYNESEFDPSFQIPLALVQEQEADINDIIEDWRDLVPEEVEEIVKHSQKTEAAKKQEENLQ